MKTYDPSQVMVTVGGRLLTGFAPDTFIEAERAADAYDLTMGVGGEGTRSKSFDRSGTIKITLLASSESNSILQAFADADEASNSGLVPTFVKDGSGSTVVMAEQSYVKKIPPAKFGAKVGQNEWLVQTDVLHIEHGGN